MSGDVAAMTRLLRRRAAEQELWVPVTGGSMGSRYPPGSRVLVRPLARLPRTGEVWVFSDAGGHLVAHRYLRRRSGRCVFRGDSERQSDSPVEPAWVVGRVHLVDAAGDLHRPRWWHAVAPLLRAGRDRLRRASERADR